MYLEDKVCIVTGSGSGIGRATAIEMGRQGAQVVVSDVDDETGMETAALVAANATATDTNVTYRHCDVRNEDEIVALMQHAVDSFGAIDVLHNNAGVHDTDFGSAPSVDTVTLDTWNAVYEINLRGLWLCTKHAAPHLRASQRGPAIVNAASIGGLIGYPMAPAYCSTKGAVIQLTKASAIDLAPVRVNCYSPGSINTAMVQKYIDAADDKEAIMNVLTGTHLIRRIGEPQEVADLVCFLASDRAAFMTGANITIDGGSTAWRGVAD